MDLPINTFKKNLKTRPQIGLWVGLAEGYGAEIAATAGFDWLLLDGEHAPNDLRAVLAQLQAVAPYHSHPIVRPATGDAVLIKQLLDIGTQTLLVPMVENAEQARQLVRATRYPPHGIRGVGAALARASRWNTVPDYLNRADEEICLLLQVETPTALQNLDEIAAVEGVDGVFIGPADLSASMAIAATPATRMCRPPLKMASPASSRQARLQAFCPPTRRWHDAIWNWAAPSLRSAWIPACSPMRWANWPPVSRAMAKPPHRHNPQAQATDGTTQR